jgi:hypothetical protein
MLFFLIFFSTSVYAPFSPALVFVLAGISSTAYALLHLLVLAKSIPYFSSYEGVLISDSLINKQSIQNAVLIPFVFFFFSLGVYLFSKYFRKEREEFQTEIELRTTQGNKFVSFSSLYWILANVFDLEEMLNKALVRILELLNIKSGMILVFDNKQGLSCPAKVKVPENIEKMFLSKGKDELDKLSVAEGEFAGSGKLLFIKRLEHRGAIVGVLVLFGQEKIDPQVIPPLEMVLRDMASAIKYGKAFRWVTG